RIRRLVLAKCSDVDGEQHRHGAFGDAGKSARQRGVESSETLDRTGAEVRRERIAGRIPIDLRDRDTRRLKILAQRRTSTDERRKKCRTLHQQTQTPPCATPPRESYV